MSASLGSKSTLVSSFISGILSLVIFGTLRFYAHWFNGSQLNVLLGGFFGSWIFILALTCISNVEALVFGQDFQAKFLPEILFSLSLAVVAAGMVHRVCATSCIFFSLVGLYFVNRISSKYYNSAAVIVDAPVKKAGKKHK